MDQIAFGTCNCGASGQLFKTGKCSHCYIAELEVDVLRLAGKTLAIGKEDPQIAGTAK